MNIRIRQKMKADHMLDKYDPIIIASVVQKDTPFRQCLIFRRSEYDEYKEKYGDDLKVWFDEL